MPKENAQSRLVYTGRLSFCHGENSYMDKLLECTRAFEKLLDTQYQIIIGRKGKTVEIIIGFSRLDFHHLMGLGKLKDLRIAKQNREAVFNEILRGIITYGGITESRYLGLLQNRFEPLMSMEQLLDDNRLVFRYNTKLNQFSLIEADYLLSFQRSGQITQKARPFIPCFIKKKYASPQEKNKFNTTALRQRGKKELPRQLEQRGSSAYLCSIFVLVLPRFSP